MRQLKMLRVGNTQTAGKTTIVGLHARF